MKPKIRLAPAIAAGLGAATAIVLVLTLVPVAHSFGLSEVLVPDTARYTGPFASPGI